MAASVLVGACALDPAVLPGDAPAPSGGAADDPGAASAGCFVAGTGDLTHVASSGTHDVGGFRVAVRSDGGIEVRAAAEPERVIFASAAGGALGAARVTLHVEEHQGSFSIDEQVSVACASPRLGETRRGGGVLALRGDFAAGGAACAALRWELQLCEARPGHLAFRAATDDPTFSRLTFRAESVAGERLWGLGEQFPHDRLDLKGREIPVLVQEGGVGRGHLPITPAVNAASPGSGGSEASTYYAAPHLVTSRRRAFFLENTEVSIFDLRPDAAIEARVHAPVVVGRILHGRTPLELVERFTEYSGRMPAPPAWVNQGAVVALARDLDESRAIVADLRARGAALAGVWNQTWSGKVKTFIGEQVLWNWAHNPHYHPGWDAFVADLDAGGVRTLCYLNPMLVDPPAEAGPVRRNLFQEALAGGYLVARADGTPYLLRVTAFDVGLLDLTHPQARAWMKDVIRDELLDRAGCSGWMVDFAEALPFDAVLFSGVPAATFHNQYAVEWMRLSREAIEEAGRLGDVLTFNRAGFTRTPAYSLLVWEGDQLTTWDKYDGLVSALHGLIGGGFSGLALNHSDTGGYTSLSAAGVVGYERERELLMRWTEMNAFTAVLRTHEGNQPGVNAQIYGDAELADHFARMSRLYRSLAPYRAQLFAEASARGWPVVRHLWMHFPDDAGAMDVNDEFLLGSELLVAPIKNKCWTAPFCPYDKEVYLPPGAWVHLWTGRTFGQAGSTAGTRVTVKAPIGQPAVFYRKGSPAAAAWLERLRGEGFAVPDGG